eukprot:GEMP01005713.1.p1 GENE.GEMP01005713.1~~GEMP01005713.1.p1  ORF type:complete len:804 (+),score=128.31 GEMP01005713.1:251-2662(+)
MLFVLLLAARHCAAQASTNVVNVESTCLKDLGKVLEDKDDHPANSPALPVVDGSVITHLDRISWPTTGDDRALRITKPGKYILDEDIVFDFEESAKNLTSPMQWGNVIGIAIEVSGVELDMDGHTLSMSDRFMGRQRFWNHIELNNMVFRGPQGLYKGDLLTPSDIIIRNGKFGQTSHMGIQGIENGRVLLEDLTFESFEVVAISCKDCNDVTIRRCTMDNTNLRVPSNSFFAQLWSTTRHIFKHKKTIAASSLMRRAWTDMRRKDWGRAFNGNSGLFEASGNLPQGSIFGIQLKTTEGRKSKVPSERALIDTVNIKNIRNGEGVRVGLSFKDKQIICQNENALDFLGYFDAQGNPKEVNGQSLDVVIFRACVITGGDEMPEALKNYTSKGSHKNIFEVDMDESGTKLKKYFGTDIRGHEPSGATGIRIKGYKNVILRNIKINGVSNGETGANLGDHSNLSAFQNKAFSNFPAVWNGPSSSQRVFKQANAYGVSFDGVTNGILSNAEIQNVQSRSGLAFGVAIGGMSSVLWLDKVSITGISVLNSNAGKQLPFLKQKAMPLFIEEATKSIAWRSVTPVSSWVAPTNPDMGRKWSEITPKGPRDCIIVTTTTTTTTTTIESTTEGGGGTTEGGGGTTESPGGTEGTEGGNGADASDTMGSLKWIVIGSLAAVLILCCCCGCICIVLTYKKRQKRQDNDQKYSPKTQGGGGKYQTNEKSVKSRHGGPTKRKKPKSRDSTSRQDGNKSPKRHTTLTRRNPSVLSSHARGNLQSSVPTKHPTSPRAKESQRLREKARASHISKTAKQ